MLKPEKHIAAVNLAKTRAIVDTKVEKLLELIATGTLDVYPLDGFISDFARWEDPELGVRRFSKSVLYTDNYRVDRLPAVEEVLEQFRAARRTEKRKSQRLKELQTQLHEEKKRANSFVDQWAQVSTELEDALKKVVSLEQDNADLRGQLVKVLPLRKAQANVVQD